VELNPGHNGGGALVTVTCSINGAEWHEIALTVTDAESVCVGDPAEITVSFPLQEKRKKAAGR
jgi:hypothetical protein